MLSVDFGTLSSLFSSGLRNVDTMGRSGGYRNNSIPTKDNPNMVPIGSGGGWGGATGGATGGTTGGMGRSAGVGGAAKQQIDYINSLVSRSSEPPLPSKQQEPVPAALQPNATPAQIAHQERIQRTVYVGNLPQGIITTELLEEFFNQSLSHLVADPIATPPVKQVKIEGAAGRFAFVEFLTEDIVKQALRMDQIVEIHGKTLNVGRPKGYIPGFDGKKAIAAAVAAASTADGPPSVLPMAPNPVLSQRSEFLLLSNIFPVGQLRDTASRDGLRGAVMEEASRHGKVVEVVVPAPPRAWEEDSLPGRVYVRYERVDDAMKGKKVFHTRTLNGNQIYARNVTQDEFTRAHKGAWVDRKKIHHGKVELPGLYVSAGALYAGGVSGILVLSPALGAQIRKDTHAWDIIRSEIIEEEVPLEKGWVKLRGFSEGVTKGELVTFLKNADPNLSEVDVNMVRSADGAHLGEAFVRLDGDKARLRLALACDKSELVTRNNGKSTKERVEVFSAHAGDLERRLLSGCVVA